MRKKFKKIFTLFFIFVACFSTVDIAFAESAPKTLKITSYNQSNIPMSFPATFRVKKTSDGKYSYCSHYAKRPPSTGITYTRGSKITDNGINYILNEAYDAKTDNDFFVYQTALWVYMVDKGIMPQPYADLTTFKSQLNNSSSKTATRIKTIVKNAKEAKASTAKDTTVKLNVDSTNLSLDSAGEYYVSDKITVTTEASEYKVRFTSAPSGTKYVTDGKTFYVKVPVSKVTDSKANVNLRVSVENDNYTSYYYNPSNSSYQAMTVTYKGTNPSADLTLSLTNSLSIVKVDSSTNKNISGAELQITNSTGKVVDKWTSTTEAHTIKNLSVGTYTLKETKAPEGYEISDTEIKFTVNSDGTFQDSNGNKITKIEFENTKTGIVISKQDITNSKELPGATLVIKDSNGKEIVSWVSTEKKHIIKGLKAGTYTLTETIAPEGYILSSETITFTVKEDGSITKVVMYNSPNTKDVPVENTASYKTVTSFIVGILIIAIGAVIIVKTSKKNS